MSEVVCTGRCVVRGRMSGRSISFPTAESFPSGECMGQATTMGSEGGAA